MHLVGENALLAASIQYGVVSRSLPLNGKILKGFLDASGTVNGLGIGNPNAEFTPNVSACAMESEGKTAKIAWGFRNGEVAVTTAAKAVDPATRGPASLVRCQVEDQHERPVKEIVWDGSAIVTSDVHGVVKIWDAKRVRCTWTSPKDNIAVPDTCSHIVASLSHGFVIVGFNSGRIIVYFGFVPPIADSTATAENSPPIQITRIDPLGDDTATLSAMSQDRPIKAMYADPHTAHEVSVVYYRNGDIRLHRLHINFANGLVNHQAFGEEAFGPVRSLIPSFATDQGELDFIVAGYQLGTVSIYNWTGLRRPSLSSTQATRTFEVHSDAITALAHNASVLLTGSEHGVVKVWDLLTLDELRAFSSPSGRSEIFPVGQIILENEMFVASVGSRVLAWKAGPVSRKKMRRLSLPGMKKSKSGGVTAKWHRAYLFLEFFAFF
jgi:hypothetical protein